MAKVTSRLGASFAGVVREEDLDEGIRHVRSWHDIAADQHCALFEVRIDGRNVRREHWDRVERVLDKVSNAKECMRLVRDYPLRPCPRLSAGTHAYRGRRA